MSTKIWVAYKVKGGVDPWSLFRDIKEAGEKEVRKILIRAYDKILASPEAMKEVRDGLAKIDRGHPKDGDVDPFDVSRFVNEAYRQQLGSMKRSAFDLDVSVAIRELNGELYLIPHCGDGAGGALEFLKADDRLEDFHYQNQTDRPKKVSAKEWDLRRDAWDAIIKAGWRHYLVLEICTPDALPYVDPVWDLGETNPWRERLKKAHEKGVK